MIVAASRAGSRSAIVENPRMSLNNTVTTSSCGSIALSGCEARRSTICCGTNEASVVRAAACSTTAAWSRLNSSINPPPAPSPAIRRNSSVTRRSTASCVVPSSVAISAYPRPWLIMSRIARSSSSACRLPVSRSAITGSTALPPACTSRIARTSSSPCETRSFSRYARPLWPPPSKAIAYSSSSCADRTTTPVSGWALRIAWAQSIPSSWNEGGILMSVTTTSGMCSLAAAMRLGASSATPTTSMSSYESSRARTPSRTRTLSSPRTTRIVMPRVPPRVRFARAARCLRGG
jgi:hypothetical protein